MTLFRGLLYTQGSLARGGLAEGSVHSIRKRQEKCHETVGYSPGGLTSIRTVSTLPNRGSQGGTGGRRGLSARCFPLFPVQTWDRIFLLFPEREVRESFR